MRIRAVVTVALAAAVVAILMAMPAFAANGGTARPYKISGNQTGSITFITTTCFENPNNPCTASFHLVGPAIGSHLGKSSVTTDNPDGLGAADDIYTAANGDKLYATDDQLAPPDINCPPVPGFGFAAPFRNQTNYSGGTGRFAHASGTTVSVGCIYIDFDHPISGLTFPFYATFSETGTLSY